MKEKIQIDNKNQNEVIDPKKMCIMCDDKVCGHCKYYDGNGYCSDGTPVRATDYCTSFRWA